MSAHAPIIREWNLTELRRLLPRYFPEIKNLDLTTEYKYIRGAKDILKRNGITTARFKRVLKGILAIPGSARGTVISNCRAAGWLTNKEAQDFTVASGDSLAMYSGFFNCWLELDALMAALLKGPPEAGYTVYRLFMRGALTKQTFLESIRTISALRGPQDEALRFGVSQGTLSAEDVEPIMAEFPGDYLRTSFVLDYRKRHEARLGAPDPETPEGTVS